MTKDKADKSQTNVQVLLEEYKFLSEQMKSNYNRMMQILTFAAVSTFGLVSILTAGLETTNTEQTAVSQALAYFATPIVAWFAPATLLALMGIALALAFWWVSYVFQIRIVSERLLKLVKEPPVNLYYHKDSVVSRIQSLRSGDFFYRANFFLIITMIALIYLYLIWFSFTRIIYPADHFAGFLYLVTYLTGTIFVILTFQGVLVSLPKTYDIALEKAKKNKGKSLLLKQIIESSVTPLQQLLPRSLDFFTKSILFITGLLFVIWETGPSYNDVIWDIFLTPGKNYHTYAWTLFAFALTWFILQEGFVQQAKYLWNDIRDRDKDKLDPHKKYRLVKDRKGDLETAIIHMIIRWGLGLFFAYFLDLQLFILLIIISFSQLIYEFWLKPRGGQMPLLALILISLGSPLRVMGGALAIGGDFTDTRLIILFWVFFFYGFGYTASYWLVEAKYAKRKKIEIRNSKQSNYFIKNGKHLEFVGFISMAIGGFSLLIESAYCCIDRGIYDLPQISQFLISSELSATLFAISKYLLFGLMIGFTGFIFTEPISQLLLSLQKRSRIWIIYAGTILIFLLSLFFVEFNQQFISAIVLTIFAIAAFFIYESLSYEQYRLVPLENNLKDVLRLWVSYIFSSDTKISLKFLLLVTSVLTSEEDDVAKKIFKARGFDFDELKKLLRDT